jgi:hypothetical protein
MRASAVITLIPVGLAALTACSPEISTFPSPDSRLVARLLDYRYGGPTVPADEKVEICPQDGPPFQCKTVFTGESMDGRAGPSGLFGPMNISWRDARTLTISYCDGNLGDIVPAVRTHDIVVVVELVKEARGDWPSSVPPDRRMGSGPCL